jgi:hypothetical protein
MSSVQRELRVEELFITRLHVAVVILNGTTEVRDIHRASTAIWALLVVSYREWNTTR